MKKLLYLFSAAILSMAACKGNHDYKTSGRDSNGTSTSGSTNGSDMQGAHNSPSTPGDTSNLGRNTQNSNGETQDPTHH